MLASLLIDRAAKRCWLATLRLIRVASFALLVASGAVSGIASAQSLDVTTSRLISQGQFKTAWELVLESDASEVEQLFFMGRVLKAQGQLERAAETFREVLRRQPRHIDARRELAHTLLLARQFNQAELRFDELLRIDPNPQMRRGYQQFLGVISRNKPFGFSGQFALLPSTNLNNGTKATSYDTIFGEFVIDEASRQKSGIGIEVGISGFWRRALDARSRAQLDWSLIHTGYRNSDYNRTVGNVSLNYRYFDGNSRWSLTPYIRQTWKEAANNSASGLRLRYDRQITDKIGFGLNVSHERRDFPIQPHQNGPFSASSLDVSHQFDASFGVKVGLGIEQSRPEAAHLQYGGMKLFASVAKAWTGGLQTDLSLTLGNRDFVGVFPLMATPRRDKYITIGGSVSKSGFEIFGLTPKLRCSYTRNRSNVNLYDFDKTECGITMVREF